MPAQSYLFISTFACNPLAFETISFNDILQPKFSRGLIYLDKFRIKPGKKQLLSVNLICESNHAPAHTTTMLVLNQEIEKGFCKICYRIAGVGYFNSTCFQKWLYEPKCVV